MLSAGDPSDRNPTDPLWKSANADGAEQIALRSLVTIACLVLSLPGASLMLLAGLAVPFESCYADTTPLECHVQHGIAVLMLLVAVIASLAYFSMASCWIGDRAESRRVRRR